MTSPHTEILAHLHRRGGEFVPMVADVLRAPKMAWCDYGNDNNDPPHFTSVDDDSVFIPKHDAHAHIELAGIKACLAMGFCLWQESGYVFSLSDGRGPERYPTLPAAILAALKWNEANSR